MKKCRLPIADCRLAAIAAVLLLACTGCPKRQSSMSKPPEVNPGPKVEASAEARANELAELAGRFEETARRLPGPTPEEDRRIVQQAFAELAHVLPILYGPNPTGAFRQQLRIVENSRSQLAASTRGLASEPTIGTGLRAAHDSLAGLVTRGYFDQEKLGQTMDRLGSTLSSLDAVRGPAHRAAVADAFVLTSQAIRQMSDALTERLTDGNAPQTRPAGDR